MENQETNCEETILSFEIINVEGLNEELMNENLKNVDEKRMVEENLTSNDVIKSEESQTEVTNIDGVSVPIEGSCCDSTERDDEYKNNTQLIDFFHKKIKRLEESLDQKNAENSELTSKLDDLGDLFYEKDDEIWQLNFDLGVSSKLVCQKEEEISHLASKLEKWEELLVETMQTNKNPRNRMFRKLFDWKKEKISKLTVQLNQSQDLFNQKDKQNLKLTSKIKKLEKLLNEKNEEILRLKLCESKKLLDQKEPKDPELCSSVPLNNYHTQELKRIHHNFKDYLKIQSDRQKKLKCAWEKEQNANEDMQKNLTEIEFFLNLKTNSDGHRT